MSVDVTYQDGMQEFDFTLNIGFQVLIMLLWETMGTGDNCWVCALTRNPSCCGESEAEVSTCDASWGVDVQKVFLEPCEDAMTIPNHAIGFPVHDIGSIMINVCAAEFFTTFYVLCCLFSLFCLVVFFWYGLCVLSSKGRRMSYSLLWAPCSQVVTFRSISARWSPASVCSFGCYGFFPLCLAPENLVIVTVALTGLPAV